jgi:hypothetical protein
MYAGEQVQTNPTERPICGLPVDTAALFVDKKGVYKPRIEKNRMKLLAKLGFLSRFLDADEKIIFVTTGCSPFTALEQLTIGAAWLIAVKRALLVFTNKRLFHIPVTTKNEYRGSLAQILYRDCKRLQVKGSTLVAEYHTGKKEKFSCIPSGDRAIIKQLNLQAEASDRPSAQPQRNHLCPNCTQLLPQGATACPACGLEFKNRATALRYSVLLPGGGYFYTGHPYMGAADAVVESYLLLVMLVTLGAGLLGTPQALSNSLGVAVVLVLEKLLTIYHSNGFLAEFIPANLKAVLSGRPVQEAPAELPPPPPIPERRQRVEDVLSVR